MESSACILCKGSKSGEVVVVKRGIDTLRRFSGVKNDGVAGLIGNSSSVQVHISCRKEYTRRISAPSADCSEIPVKRNVRTSITGFDFKRQCLFCEKEIDTNYKSKHPERQPLYSVATTLHVIESVRSMASKRSDSWGRTVLLRINTEVDLVAAEARYHRVCYAYFSRPGSIQPTYGQPSASGGRSEDPNKLRAFQELCDYLENRDNCQYTFQELNTFMKSVCPNEEPYSEKHLKRKLQHHYGDNIVIAEQVGKSSVLCFTGVAHQILTDNWYAEKKNNPNEEKMRIVETAAKIIRQDIRSRVYNCTQYPTKEEISSGNEDLIPPTLQTMIKVIVQTRKPFKDDEPTRRKAITIAHAIIATARPRSFISPLQLGLGVHLHRRYGSKLLLDMLSKLGTCASYRETINFENSVVQNTPPSVDDDAFVQFVFDNADYNVKTLDGHGTFHAMGGIKCIAPAKSVNASAPVPRMNFPPENADLVSMGLRVVTPYQRPVRPGTAFIQAEDVSNALSVPKTYQDACLIDTLWMWNYQLEGTLSPSWSGFMDATTTADPQEYETAAVIPLPFVNLSPSNPSTIYTCLLYAVEQCKSRNQSSCVVTFDQPLYAKALDIVLADGPHSPLSCVILRLGGFHLLMSYMGAVGAVMAGSGLEDLWEIIYAKNTVVHMVTGHAYSRAIRAHFLTQVSLAILLFDDLKITNSNLTQRLKAAHAELLRGDVSLKDVCAYECLTDAVSLLEVKLEKEAASSRTAKLWVQYFRMVNIMRLFIRAERSGDWNLHLYCVQSMIPYLHAGGHLNYAKFAHIYLQQMLKLEEVMSSSEFNQFVNRAHFTVRRSDKFWSGIWTDMTIEQVLMRTMKTAGGLTHGRGMSEKVIARWVSAMPASSNIVDAIESFSGVFSETSEQHVELRESRQIRDKTDVKKMVGWLQHHHPFKVHSLLVSLSSRLVADYTVNCDEAHDRGLEAMRSIVGQRFSEVHLKRKDKVRSLGSMAKTIKIKNTFVEINPNQLFHRLLCVVRTKEELSEYFKYELAARPPALFDGAVMRKGKKSAFIGVLEQLAPYESSLPTNPVFTVDGGFLLHRVVWLRPANFNHICVQYVKYITTHYGENVTVVFDGYSLPSTKDEERAKRSGREAAVDAVIEDNTPSIVPQGVFLANQKNKVCFIALLAKHLESAGVKVLQAEGDADTLIVSTSVQTSRAGRNSVLVGEDTDLLVLLAATSEARSEVRMLIPGKKGANHRVFSSEKLRTGLGDVLPHILFFHAATGCDTTSAPYRIGKNRSFKKLQTNDSLRQKVVIFNKSDATHNEIAAAGESFLLDLYSCNSTSSLDAARHRLYVRTVAKQSVKSMFDLATLPPTSSAARQHSYRVYHQVQEWKGVSLPATDWGWTLNDGRYKPVPNTQDPAPENILHIICCNCKSGCERNCECRRSGLCCTTMCGYCAGHGCENRTDLPVDDDTVDDAEDDGFNYAED